MKSNQLKRQLSFVEQAQFWMLKWILNRSHLLSASLCKVHQGYSDWKRRVHDTYANNINHTKFISSPKGHVHFAKFITARIVMKKKNVITKRVKLKLRSKNVLESASCLHNNLRKINIEGNECFRIEFNSIMTLRIHPAHYFCNLSLAIKIGIQAHTIEKSNATMPIKMLSITSSNSLAFLVWG